MKSVLAIALLAVSASAQSDAPRLHILFEQKTAMRTEVFGNVKAADGKVSGFHVSCRSALAVNLADLVEDVPAILALHAGNPIPLARKAISGKPQSNPCTVEKQAFHYGYSATGELEKIQ